MTTSPPAPSPLQCPACGAPQPAPAPDQRYIRCGHCGTTTFLDLGGLRRHLVAEPQLKPADAAGEVRAAGATAASIELRQHPFWEFAAAGRTLALDAVPDSPPELGPRPLASGHRRAAEPGDAPNLPPPTLRPGAAAHDASKRLQVQVTEADATLVHHPLYVARLADGRELWVDGVEGGIIQGAVARGRGVAYPYAVLAVGAACGLLLPAPFDFLGVMAAAAWPLRRYLVR